MCVMSNTPNELPPMNPEFAAELHRLAVERLVKVERAARDPDYARQLAEEDERDWNEFLREAARKAGMTVEEYLRYLRDRYPDATRNTILE